MGSETLPERYYTISALNQYLKAKVEKDDALQRILLQAELSNFKHHTSGHLYFSLKDEKSQIAAVMFRSDALRLTFAPKDGDKVLLEGRVSVYEGSGANQVYVQKMSLDGIGELYLRFEQLKERLQKEGWFDASRKRPIPSMPKTIGVVTSPTGAAIHDILHILERRWPLVKVLLYPALVQGADAKHSIKAQIEKANKDRLADVLIVGRGGGSIEDLWAFNEELVLKAILDSRIPVISAVGHETDVTLADYVADRRAPTPSAAAEIAVPDQVDFLRSIDDKINRLKTSAIQAVRIRRREAEPLFRSPTLQSPRRLIERSALAFDQWTDRLSQVKPDAVLRRNLEQHALLRERLVKTMLLRHERECTKQAQLHSMLEAFSPLSVLKQGYAIATQHQRPIASIEQLDPKSLLTVRFSDGEADCTVETMRKESAPWTKP
jgi:exodeoxyribonuclease VII large subunit